MAGNNHVGHGGREPDRHRGRPPRRWVDNIVDWCGRPLPEMVQLTADTEKWRRVVTGLNGLQEP